VPGALAKMKTPPRSISRHKLHHQICTVKFTKREKSRCNNFQVMVQSHGSVESLYEVQALPLNFVRFLRLAIRSPMIQRSPARRSRNVREPSGKKSGEMSRSLPHNFPAMAGQWQCNAAEFPRG
jgi:hypothetical protein